MSERLGGVGSAGSSDGHFDIRPPMNAD